LDDASIRLTVADMLELVRLEMLFQPFEKLLVCNSGCRANRAIYNVSRLSMRPSFNLDELTNITNVSGGSVCNDVLFFFHL